MRRRLATIALVAVLLLSLVLGACSPTDQAVEAPDDILQDFLAHEHFKELNTEPIELKWHWYSRDGDNRCLTRTATPRFTFSPWEWQAMPKYTESLLEPTPDRPSTEESDIEATENLMSMYKEALADLGEDVGDDRLFPYTDLARNPDLMESTLRNKLIFVSTHTAGKNLNLGDYEPGIAILNSHSVLIIIVHKDGSHQIWRYQWNGTDWVEAE